jgi:hypothetical protein
MAFMAHEIEFYYKVSFSLTFSNDNFIHEIKEKGEPSEERCEDERKPKLRGWN